MAATVSAWAKPGAWALDSEENETELLQQHKEDVAPTKGAETADFPSLSAAAATKTNKKKKAQKLSLQEFTTYSVAKQAVFQAKGLTPEEMKALPTGPRERSAEELDRDKIGNGFRNYGTRDEQPRRQRDSDREFVPSRADETDNWAVGKKSSVNTGFERRERGERNGFFPDSQSRADEVDNWGSKKSFVPSEPRRYEKRTSFGLESGDGRADSGNWGRRKEEEGRSAFDSLRERRGGFESNGADSDSWGKKREEVSAAGGRPKLNLKPRTLPVPVIEVQKVEINNVLPVSEVQKDEIAVVAKPKASNPFGEARPREEVLKEKGQDWKEIEEKLEATKIKEVISIGSNEVPVVAKRGFWGGNGRDRVQLEDKTWRKPESVGSRPQSAGGSENGTAENSENGTAENTENGHAEKTENGHAEERNTEM